MVKVIWHKAVSPQHTDVSVIFARRRQCTVHNPVYRKTKMVAMATSLSRRVSAISALCWPTTQTPLHNQLPSCYHSHKASYGNFSPKIGCYSNDLRHSISAMSSSDSLTLKSWKPTPTIKQRVASYHATKSIAHRKPKISCHGNVP